MRRPRAATAAGAAAAVRTAATQVRTTRAYPALRVASACRVLAKGQVPQTRHVRGSNFALINVYEDRIAGRAIVICVIDNVCKGASGQAIQNLNVMMGCRESTAIDLMPLFP